MGATDFIRHASSFVGNVSAPRRQHRHAEGFYVPPAPLWQWEPGEIVRRESMHAYLVPGVRLRAKAERILYRSTSAEGDPTAVSGVVLMPPGPDRVRPLVGYAIGTHGIGDGAAPSRLLAHGLDWEAALIAMCLSRGWAVAVTDYQGLGTSGDHTYMVGRALGMNVLDCMRAARKLHPHLLPENGPAGIIGYSEGGAAAGWAAQLQPTYAPEIELAAIACGGTPADPTTAVARLEKTFFSFFIAYGGLGYAAAYSELDIESHLTDEARGKIGALRDSTVIDALRRGPHFASASSWTDVDLFSLPEWRARLDENRLGLVVPQAPVLLCHARRDQIVSYEQSVYLYETWGALGADVRFHTTKGAVEHVTGAVAAMPVAIDWLDKRLTRASSAAGPRHADATPLRRAA
jgi:fermentation-respiration switch protein FrsA (DUF1100 family)